MTLPGMPETGFVSPEKYDRHRSLILDNSTALQVRQDGSLQQGMSDEELCTMLKLTPWEVREIRAIAKREAATLADWRRADERMQQMHERFVAPKRDRT
jgi:hypothetical protein